MTYGHLTQDLEPLLQGGISLWSTRIICKPHTAISTGPVDSDIVRASYARLTQLCVVPALTSSPILSSAS